MSAYYDLFEKPDVRQTGEQQSLYARFVPKCQGRRKNGITEPFKNRIYMSAYYDLFEKPDVRQTGEQQSLYARFVPKGTIDRKEFIERVHLFTGLSRSLLEGAMAGFMDELRDCLANGWTVELGELGYFTPSLSCTRQATDKKELRAASIALRSLLEGAMAGFMDELRDCLANGWTVELGELGYFTPSLSCTRQATDKKELRAASIALRGLNFRLGREFYKDLKGKMQLERCPQSASAPASSADEALGVEQRWQLLDEYLQQYPCINRSQYARLAGRSYKQAVVDLNRFIEEGVLMRHGMGPSVVYARKR